MDHLVMESEVRTGIRIKKTKKVRKGKNGKGKVYCQVCEKSDHQVHQCWWSTQQHGAQTQQSSQNSRQVYNVSEYPQDQPIQKLVNMNGGEIKILGEKVVTYITHKVVMTITFLIAEDAVNPIIGLDALHQNEVQTRLFQSGKAYLQQKGQRAVLRYFRNHSGARGPPQFLKKRSENAGANENLSGGFAAIPGITPRVAPRIVGFVLIKS